MNTGDNNHRSAAGRHGVTRRDLLKMAALSGAGLVSLFSLANCSPAAPAPATQAPAAPKATEAPKPAATTAPAPAASAAPAPAATQAAASGGTVTVIVPQSPPSLDMQTSSAKASYWPTMCMHEFLCRYDASGKAVPSLAKKWDYIDPKTISFDLPEGVKFHNGRELVADDIKKNVERILDPKVGATLRTQMAPVDGVEAKGKYTAIFHLKNPWVFLFDKLVYLPIYPVEEIAAGKDPKTNPIGAGPFMFKEWRTDQYIDVVRFPDYYRKGYPKVDRIRFMPLSDAGAQRSTFLAKSADVLQQIRNADYDGYKAQADIYLKETPLSQFFMFAFNTKKAPWDNVKVRQAVKYAVDRKAIVDAALMGKGLPAFAPVLPDSPYYTKEIEYQRDLPKAKQLLAEAGFPNGLEDTTLVINTPNDILIAQVFQSQMKEAGINLKFETMEGPTLVDRVFNKKDQAVSEMGHTGPDMQRVLDLWLLPNGTQNMANYSNPKMTQLLTSAAAEPDDAKRAKIYQDALKLLVEDVPEIYLVTPTLITAAYKSVEGFTTVLDNTIDWSGVTTTKK